MTVDLETQTLTLPDGRQVTFPVDSFSRYCLLNGVDQLGFLLGLDEHINAYEGENPARIHTVAV